MTRTLCFRALALTLLTLPAVALMALPAYAQQGGDAPPGNNGTIKIDGVLMDEGNENNPHPGCTFVVDFFGYDVGTRTATLEFEGQAPTGGGMLLTDTFTFEVASRESGNELNHSQPVDLSDELAGIEPHPQQGWHVKLTAHVDGSQGSDRKHKVFWISECAEAGDVMAEEESVVPAAPDEVMQIAVPVPEVVDVVQVEAANVAAWNAAVWAAAMEANAAQASAPAAEPEVAVLSSGATAAPAGTLPRTGAGTSWSLTLGILSIAAGVVLLHASRRRLLA
jgi:LPXTG-motif cell wall-anchored protein